MMVLPDVFLVVRLFFACLQGDLKSYLISNREDQEAFLERGLLLKFACEMAAGLACMHRHDFIHRLVSLG